MFRICPPTIARELILTHTITSPIFFFASSRNPVNAIRRFGLNRKATTPILVFALAFLVPSTSAYAIFDVILGGFVAGLVARSSIDHAKDAAKEAIDDLDRRVKDRIAQAGDRLDESTMRASEEISKRLEQARQYLNEMIDRTFEKAASERKEFFLQLAQERGQFFGDLDILLAKFEGVENSIVQGFDDTASRLLRHAARELDSLQETIRGISTNPWYRQKPRLVRLYGSGQIFKAEGTYRILAVGFGFGEEDGRTIKGMSVSLNEVPLPEQRQRFDSAFPYTRVIEVPVSQINSSFSDNELVPTTIRFRSRDLSAERQIVLFPKFPVRYRLRVSLQGVSQQVYVKSPGAGFLDDEEDLVRDRLGHSKNAAAPQGVDQAVRVRLGEIVELMRDRLPFGSFTVDLPAGASWDDLDVRWFNGDGVTLHPARNSGLGVRVSRPSQIEGRQRLRIDVGLPEG